MTPNEYQTAAARTLISKPDAEYTAQQTMLVWNATGLAGEAGEVVDTIKKTVFHRHGITPEGEFTPETIAELKKELGDTLWYVAAICSTLGFTLEEVMQLNIEKLLRRYPDGYNSEASKSRVDVTGSEGDKAFADSLLRMMEKSG